MHSHTGHLQQPPLVQMEIHSDSFSFNGRCWALKALHCKRHFECINFTSLHAPSVVFTLAFTSAMQTSGYCNHSFTFNRVQTTCWSNSGTENNLKQGARKQKNSSHYWGERARFIDMVGEWRDRLMQKWVQDKNQYVPLMIWPLPTAVD